MAALLWVDGMTGAGKAYAGGNKGTCSPMTGIEPDFHCDYGFNIHTHGLAVINYNCVILDTSPVNIGEGLISAVPSDIKNSAVNTFMWNQQTSETSV